MVRKQISYTKGSYRYYFSRYLLFTSSGRVNLKHTIRGFLPYGENLGNWNMVVPGMIQGEEVRQMQMAARLKWNMLVLQMVGGLQMFEGRLFNPLKHRIIEFL